MSYISGKITSFCLEPNLRQGWRVGQWRRRGKNNILGYKRFLINSEVQNSGKVCPDKILQQEKKLFTVLICIQICIRVEGSMNDVGQYIILESKLAFVKRKTRRLIEQGGLCQKLGQNVLDRSRPSLTSLQFKWINFQFCG